MKLRNKLVVKLLGAIAVSLFTTFIMCMLLSRFFVNLVGVDYFTKLSDEKSMLLLYLLLLLLILTFIAVLFLLLRKKLLYLKHISDSVNDIAKGRLGLQIGLKGRDELTKLAENINEMSQQLEKKFEHERQLEIAKNELITNVSHDLRTPLTSIIGYLDLIMKKQYDREEQFQEYMEMIYSKSQRLKNLIDELFEYTRLSSPDLKLNLHEMDLARLLEQLVGEYIPIFEKEQLSVRKSITVQEIPILIDVEKMVRVYENLFANAIKYSVKPSDVYISLERKGDQAILTVSNRVENPPEEDVTKWFERFFREDKARNNHGSGLGLAISKKIIELHNGTISGTYRDGRIFIIVTYPMPSPQ